MIRVNVCAEGNDWLFADLKDGFRSAGSGTLQVVVTETPVLHADAWVFIRTREACASSDLARTVVCIHDLYELDGMYLPGGEREAVRTAGGLVLSHPAQREILCRMGIRLEGRQLLERPLGALRIFQPRLRMPEVFTIGWCGRYHWRKRPEWLFECCKLLADTSIVFRISLVGKDLAS